MYPSYSRLNFLKFESYHGPGPKDRHGYDGPIYVGPGQHRSHKLESQFIEAVRQFNWPELDDINDLDSSNGCMRALRYVNPQGSREDVGHDSPIYRTHLGVVAAHV